MWSVCPLTEFTQDDLNGFGDYGYRSSVVYDLQNDAMTEMGVNFSLVPKKLEHPFWHSWPIGGFEMAFFKRQIEKGQALGLYVHSELHTPKNLVGMVVCESQGWHRTLYISTLFVAEPYRGQGGARCLLESVEALAKTQGLKFVALEAQHKNGNAIDFYRHCGYSITGLDFGKYKGTTLVPEDVAVFLQKQV